MTHGGVTYHRGGSLDRLGPRLREQAEAMVAWSRWPNFSDLLVVAVVDGDGDGPVVVGTTSAAGDELLFLVAEEWRGQNIATRMVEALLPGAIEGATCEAVLGEEWVPPYSAVAGSEAGAAFLWSLSSRFGWRAWALIDWSGYDEEKAMARG